MNPIKRMFMGEDVRRSIQGISPDEIIKIIKDETKAPETSPFAKAVGLHLAAERTKFKGPKKGKKRYHSRADKKLAKPH